MRPLLTFILSLIFGLSNGQDFSYPMINIHGQNINDFIPPGWIIKDSAKGDLNKDGLADAVIVLQHIDSVTLVQSEDSIITQPRILLILFKNIADKSYHVSEQSNSFILNHDNAIMDDPYQGLTIEKGVLKINFHLFYSMGSWYMTSSSYNFRYDGKTFILIGADLSTIHRATLEFEDYSYNFLAKKRTYSKGNEQKGTKKTSGRSVFISSFMTFRTFIKPFTWEVEKNIYL